MTTFEVGMRIRVNANGVQSEMGGVDRAVRKTGDAARDAGDGFKTLHDRMLRYAAGGLVLRQAGQALRAVIDNTVRQEQAFAQIEARLRSTGGVAGHTAGEIARMAARFQQATSFGDEAILEMQGVLLSFRSVTGAAFEGATEAVLNLSTALGQDLRSVAIQVGKALDDPKRGLDALSRSGTTFTEAQKEQIRALSEAGRTAEAQQIILRELEEQYGGAAIAARDTLGGALAALGNTWGDLLEVEAEATEGLREWVERLNRALGDVDVRELHEDLIDIGEIGAWLAGAVIVRLVGSTGIWIAKMTAASVASRAAGVAAAFAGAKADLARLKMLRAAPAAERYGIAMNAAAGAARNMGRAASLLFGPAGIAVLAATAIYQFATANDEAAESADDARGAIDKQVKSVAELTEEMRGLGEASRAARIIELRRQRDTAAGLAEDARAKAGEARGEHDRLANVQEEIRPEIKLTLEEAEARREALRPYDDAATLLERDAEKAEERARRAEERLRRSQEARVRAEGGETRSDALGLTRVPSSSAPDEPAAGGADKAAREYERTRRALLTARERIREDHLAHLAAIDASDASAAEKADLRQRAGAERARRFRELDAREAAAEAERKRRADEAAARAAEEKADAERRAGVGAAERIREASARLAAQRGLGRTAIEEQNRAFERALELRRTYPEASAEVLAEIEAETAAYDRNAAAQARRLDLLDRFGGAAIDERERQDTEDLTELYDRGQLSRAEYEAAITRIALDAERERQEQLLALKREGWDRELLEAQGYRDRAGAEEAAARERIVAEESRGSDRVREIRTALVDFQYKKDDERLQAGLEVARTSAGQLAAHSKKAYRIEQAAALASATVSIARGVAAGLAKGFPVGTIEAALTAAAGAVQIAAIRSQRPPQAFARGGIVEDATFFTARRPRRPRRPPRSRARRCGRRSGSLRRP